MSGGITRLLIIRQKTKRRSSAFVSRRRYCARDDFATRQLRSTGLRNNQFDDALGTRIRQNQPRAAYSENGVTAFTTSDRTHALRWSDEVTLIIARSRLPATISLNHQQSVSSGRSPVRDRTGKEGARIHPQNGFRTAPASAVDHPMQRPFSAPGSSCGILRWRMMHSRPSLPSSDQTSVLPARSTAYATSGR